MHESEPLLEILAVEPVEPDGSVLRGIALARPRPGDPGTDHAGTFGFDVSGWVLGAALVLSVISLVQQIGERGVAFDSGIEMISCALTAAGLYFSFTGDAVGWFDA